MHIKRRHDTAQPPFDRLCQTSAITPEHRECLEALRDRTNPLQLHQEIYDLLDVIISMPRATPGVVEDVHRTLSTSSSRRQHDSSLLTLSFNRTLIAEERAAY